MPLLHKASDVTLLITPEVGQEDQKLTLGEEKRSVIVQVGKQ